MKERKLYVSKNHTVFEVKPHVEEIEFFILYCIKNNEAEESYQKYLIFNYICDMETFQKIKMDILIKIKYNFYEFPENHPIKNYIKKEKI